ncbi:MAG: nuclear transport factor 2 family protein [Candidatus Binataceae bacterium]|jgi:ketosteroid isomerase-like protein
MTVDRASIERLLRELYSARVGGDREAVCRLFADDAKFEMAGASHPNPIMVKAIGVGEIRPLLTLMIKMFKLSDYEILTMIIDSPNAAVHWRAKVQSRITGAVVLTELVDLVEAGDNGRIVSYKEFFLGRHLGGEVKG